MDNPSNRRAPASQHAYPSQHTGPVDIIDLTGDNEPLPISIEDADSNNADVRIFSPTENRLLRPEIQPRVLSVQHQSLSQTQPVLTPRFSQLQLNSNGKRSRDDDDDPIEGNMHHYRRSLRIEQNNPGQSTDYNTAFLNAQDSPRQGHSFPREQTVGNIPSYHESRLSNPQETTLRESNQTVSTNSSNDIEFISSNDNQPDVLVTANRRVKRVAVPPPIIDHNKRRRFTASHNGVVYQPGKSVELEDGAFMRIEAIYEDEPESPILVGTIFTRIERFLPMPTRRTATGWGDNSENNPDTRFDHCPKGHNLVNELVQRILVQDGECKEDFGLWRRPIHQVIREITLNLIDSNDEDTFLYDYGIVLGTAIYDELWFTCRWREVRSHDRSGVWKEQRIERIPRSKLDEQRQVAQEPRVGGLLTTTSYTFVDAFCSAGGVSTGARQAGLNIKHAFDKDENKMATYVVNFGGLDGGARAMGVDEFIDFARHARIRTDVLHLSPPCQPFSQANSTPNEQKNEMNQPPLLACSELIKILKPRVVTVEEAPGIRMRHAIWFDALIWQFTSIGYSLRWKNIKCADFGVPQTRKRLMIIAAAHGEDLPPFPESTHISGACSIQQTLRELEQHARTTEVTHHRPGNTRVFQPKPAYDANCLANTITTSGGSNYHPSGLRDFTIREYAALQTFPFQFGFGTRRDFQEFSLVELKTQIGNAVPPAVAAAIYRSVVKSLNKCDERALTRRRAGNHNEVIVV